MSGDVQLELWLHEYKLDALASVLAKEGTTVEQRMQDALTELYVSLVPPEVRQEINARIKEDLAARDAEIETARKCAVFHVREDGREEYFRLDQNQELLDTARTLRRYLRQEPGADAGSFSALFPRREAITPDEFERLVLLRMENTGKVTGAFDIDFDRQEVSTVDAAEGWKTWFMQDVSTAVFQAYRKSYLRPEQYMSRFLEKLEGKELTSPGHLSAQDISLAEEICRMDGGQLNFYLESVFDVDKVFGTNVSADENDDTLNVYANYDMATGRVCDELEVYLILGDGREEVMEYHLNAVEKVTLLRKMDAYCQEQAGQTLAEYSAQRMAEDMAPPIGPTM